MFAQIALSYATYEAIKKIKRYVVGASVGFGKTYKIGPLSITAPKPIGDKIKLFDSAKDALADYPANGAQQWFNTKSNPEIKFVTFVSPSDVKNLMEYPGNPYEYVKKHQMICSFQVSGKIKYFRYHPSFMLMYVSYSEDPATFKKIQDAAALEKSLIEYAQKAQRNARALAALARVKGTLSPEAQNKLNIAIRDHQYEINTINQSIPVGFHVQTVSLSAANIGAIGVVPVIIWVVAIIVSGVIVTTYVVGKYITEVTKRKQILDNNLKNIQAITDAEKLYKAGLITKEGLDNITNAATKAIDTNTASTASMDKQDAKGGILGQMTNMLLIGGVIILGKEFLKK